MNDTFKLAIPCASVCVLVYFLDKESDVQQSTVALSIVSCTHYSADCERAKGTSSISCVFSCRIRSLSHCRSTLFCSYTELFHRSARIETTAYSFFAAVRFKRQRSCLSAINLNVILKSSVGGMILLSWNRVERLHCESRLEEKAFKFILLLQPYSSKKTANCQTGTTCFVYCFTHVYSSVLLTLVASFCCYE